MDHEDDARTLIAMRDAIADAPVPPAVDQPLAAAIATTPTERYGTIPGPAIVVDEPAEPIDRVDLPGQLLAVTSPSAVDASQGPKAEEPSRARGEFPTVRPARRRALRSAAEPSRPGISPRSRPPEPTLRLRAGHAPPSGSRAIAIAVALSILVLALALVVRRLAAHGG